MQLNQKYFINPRMLASNVLEVDVPKDLLDSLKPIITEVASIDANDGFVALESTLNYGVVQPDWNSDLRWISQGDEATFAWFESLFQRSGAADQVEQYIDFQAEIRLYSGFFVTRKWCRDPHFHVDWKDGRNDAFTYLAPVSANCEELGLLYRNVRGEVCEYTYRRGKALIFGDHFEHAVKQGETAEPVVLLSFAFGTDRIERWPEISQTIGYQGPFLCRPDGVFERRL
jgi:hypothetical protein